jgi:hypothetical protein
LQAVDADSAQIPEFVDVVIERSGRIVLQSNLGRPRPCPGGFGIACVGGGVGTLGGVVKRESDWCYILSNNHVLARNDPTRGPIRQPAFDPGTTRDDMIATLEDFIPIEFDGRFNEVDCAIAKINSPSEEFVSRCVKDIGIPERIGVRRSEQLVRKSGYSTELRTGTLKSDNATFNSELLGRPVIFVRQLKCTVMSARGDSGALIWDATEPEVIGLLIGGNLDHTFGNRIEFVLDRLGVSLV